MMNSAASLTVDDEADVGNNINMIEMVRQKTAGILCRCLPYFCRIKRNAVSGHTVTRNEGVLQ